mgnify:CR=1 FL=1
MDLRDRPPGEGAILRVFHLIGDVRLQVAPGTRESPSPRAAMRFTERARCGTTVVLRRARAEELDAVVTDDGLDEETAQEYRAAGVQLEMART